MWEKLLKWASGINNLKGVFYGRLVIGLIFIFYGFAVFYFSPIRDIWIKWSILLAFLGIGATFVLDGQSILREYFTKNQKTKIEISQDSLIDLLKLSFVIGSLLLFFKFYTLKEASLYPIVLFLIFIILAIIIINFRKDIISFKISKEGFEINLGNRTSSLEKKLEDLTYETNESKKTEWNFEIKEKKKNGL